MEDLKVAPVPEVCCEVCYYASGAVCECDCGGRYHGRGYRERLVEAAEKAGLKVNWDYEKALYKLSETEFQALVSSIQTNGQYEPITVNEGGVILDGHHRLRACAILGIEPSTRALSFDDPLLEELYVRETNLRRRHLNRFQRVELAIPLLEIQTKLARRRQIELGKTHGNPLLSDGTRGKAVEAVARHPEIAVSPRTFYRAKKVIEEAPEELKQKCRTGEVSVTYAYKLLKRTEEEANPPPLPEGVFDVIYADPPWRYDVPLTDDPNFYYSVPKPEKIAQVQVPAADDAVLFLWATSPLLRAALRVMDAWSFDYKSQLVWLKDRWGTGHYVRGQHELLLLGTKGKWPTPLPDRRPSSIIEAPKREHSRKPDAVYDLIEAMYPNRHYLELFARNHREGWESWGLEVGDNGGRGGGD